MTLTISFQPTFPQHPIEVKSQVKAPLSPVLVYFTVKNLASTIFLVLVYFHCQKLELNSIREI